ncbi:sensor histidine kinase [Rubrivirga sp. IMCC43871]|uniref:sensor histidine kinase n=1 Tax=Rubrivirga sp. IMCC43871 TaxID=3391575 RepID=UPI00398FCB85
MQSLVFVALTPLALLLMGVVGIVSWRRREAPGAWGLVAFSAASAGWLACDALSVLAPSPEAALRIAQGTFVWAPLPGVAWFAFLLSYTGRVGPVARASVWALCVWSLGFGGMALTNEVHQLVLATWEVVPDGPFLGVRYTLGPVAWAQTVFMWGAMIVSLAVLVRAYASGTRDRTLSWWIVAGAAVPLAVNVGHMLGVGTIEKDFTPIAMAVSSGAFALGLVRYRLLDLRPIARAALVDVLSEGMLVLDTHGVVVDANPALRCALGEATAPLGRPLRETVPSLADAIDSAPGDTFRLGEGPDARYVDFRISPLTDRHGTPTGRLVLLHDVTHRRRERAALHRANADLYDANAELQARNDELDAFAHTVAHDLKNGIQGVAGYAEILRDDGPGLPAGAHHEIADGLVGAAHKMGDIVHELLLLAGVRQATVEPRPVEMAAVAQEALHRIRRTPIGTAVAPALPDHWPVAVGHAPWVEEIWVNYLSNAAKYGGPTLTLGAETTPAGQARFWVHDDGPGLAPDAQAQLFMPFSRVGSLDVEGHGLGLSIVRRITERLGGTCGVESAPGAGTRFWFALPLSADDAAQSSSASRSVMA